MARQFAANTTVPIARTRDAIEQTLKRYGAGMFGYVQNGDEHQIMFAIDNRRMRFALPYLPRTGNEQKWEQDCRARWRALLLVIKAKLEAVRSGITTIEQEFLAHIVTGNGRTVGEALAPQLSHIYSGEHMPRLLLTAGDAE